MDSSAVQEIANQIGVAVENVIPAYAHASLVGNWICFGIGLLFLIVGIVLAIIGYRRAVDYGEGFFPTIFGVMFVIIGIVIVLFVGYLIFMWTNFPDMMFLNKIISNH